MGNFKTWITEDVTDSTESLSDFTANAERVDGFQPNTTASSVSVNSAIRQNSLVAVGLMEAILPDSTLDLQSTQEDVTTAIGNYFDDINSKIIGGFSYDLVIRTQEEFDTMIASSTWLDAKSVAIVEKSSPYIVPTNGIKIQSNVYQVKGFGDVWFDCTGYIQSSSTYGVFYKYVGAQTNEYKNTTFENINITGTVSNSQEAVGGCVMFQGIYNMNNCVIETVTCAQGGYFLTGFRNCYNVTNCQIKNFSSNGDCYGFQSCDNISKCYVNVSCVNESTAYAVYGFYGCNNLSDLRVYVSNTASADVLTNFGDYVFDSCGRINNVYCEVSAANIIESVYYAISNCSYLCNIFVKNNNGYFGSYYNVSFASNCGYDIGAGFAGTNTYVDSDSCKIS